MPCSMKSYMKVILVNVSALKFLKYYASKMYCWPLYGYYIRHRETLRKSYIRIKENRFSVTFSFNFVICIRTDGLIGWDIL